MPHPEITQSSATIHRPGEPRHFMRLRPIERRVRVTRGGEVLAESTGALRLVEVGKDVYDPTVYLPEPDVRARLARNDLATHCPLKGDAIYFDLVAADGSVVQEKIAWAYPEPFDFAADLAGRIAFYAEHVTIEEGQ